MYTKYFGHRVHHHVLPYNKQRKLVGSTKKIIYYFDDGPCDRNM